MLLMWRSRGGTGSEAGMHIIMIEGKERNASEMPRYITNGSNHMHAMHQQ
jgi:hypothetical protein